MLSARIGFFTFEARKVLRIFTVRGIYFADQIQVLIFVNHVLRGLAKELAPRNVKFLGETLNLPKRFCVDGDGGLYGTHGQLLMVIPEV
jgi:hypothetical protein